MKRDTSSDTTPGTFTKEGRESARVSRCYFLSGVPADLQAAVREREARHPIPGVIGTFTLNPNDDER